MYKTITFVAFIALGLSACATTGSYGDTVYDDGTDYTTYTSHQLPEHYEPVIYYDAPFYTPRYYRASKAYQVTGVRPPEYHYHGPGYNQLYLTSK